MATIKRERWTEADVLALPPAEHDFVERKGGLFLTADGFREDLEKVVSALANSGGGRLLIGVANDGRLEGVEPRRGRTTTREWLEQLIGPSVAPPLADFRVHEVVRAVDGSAIPQDRVIIVVDVGDSALAPHQAESQKIYFYRQAGRSARAPHFYLEALRSRLIGPKLRPELKRLDVQRRYAADGGSFVECVAVFWVHNEGNVAAYKWTVIVDSATAGNNRRWCFNSDEFPRAVKQRGGVPIGDETILPGLVHAHKLYRLGFFIRGAPVTLAEMLREVRQVMEGATLTYRAVSEVSRGEAVLSRLEDVVDAQELARDLVSRQVDA